MFPSHEERDNNPWYRTLHRDAWQLQQAAIFPSAKYIFLFTYKQIATNSDFYRSSLHFSLIFMETVACNLQREDHNRHLRHLIETTWVRYLADQYVKLLWLTGCRCFRRRRWRDWNVLENLTTFLEKCSDDDLSITF